MAVILFRPLRCKASQLEALIGGATDAQFERVTLEVSRHDMSRTPVLTVEVDLALPDGRIKTVKGGMGVQFKGQFGLNSYPASVIRQHVTAALNAQFLSTLASYGLLEPEAP